MKICTKCKVEKPEGEFSKDSRKKCGLRSACKSCRVAQYAVYAKENPDKIKARYAEYYAANLEKLKVRGAEYRAANPEKERARGDEYRAFNQEKVKARHSKYYAVNRESVKARSAAYRAANPEKKAANKRNRRAREFSAEGKHTATDVRAIFEKQQGLCANCETKLFKSGKQKFHVDHVMPLALGGSNWPCNLQCLCPACNLSKGAKHPDEWARQQGKLL